MAVVPDARRNGPLPVKPSKVILCSSAKGGCAKTTTSRNLASLAASHGYRVATIDLDPQETLTRWWSRRPDVLPAITNYNLPLADAGQAVPEIAASGQHDIIVVDTPPGVEQNPASLKGVLGRSDLLLVPTTDGGEDLESASEWMSLVSGEVARPAFFLLCLTERELTSLGEAKQYLSDKGRICPHDVRRMQAIKRSYNNGTGAADFTGRNGKKAAEDYLAVWNFVRLELGLEARK